MKKIGSLIIIALITLSILLLAKNMLAKGALSAGIKTITGLKLDIKELNLGVTKGLVEIKDLKLFNPSGFEDRIMIDLPEVYADCRLSAFLRRKVYLEELRIHLKDFLIVKNRNGKLNLDSLTAVKASKDKAASGKKKRDVLAFRIDTLRLKIDKVRFKDYSQKKEPIIKEFNLSLDEKYENIDDPYAFINLVVVRAIKKAAIAELIGFDLNSLRQGLFNILDTAAKITKDSAAGVGKVIEKTISGVKEAVTDTADIATNTVKDILPLKE